MFVGTLWGEQASSYVYEVICSCDVCEQLSQIIMFWLEITENGNFFQSETIFTLP